ncbi:MAG: hypothetical protein ACI8XO_002962 [Verrucomicrobiales bacterium]|jgi:hypothetical protein
MRKRKGVVNAEATPSILPSARPMIPTPQINAPSNDNPRFGKNAWRNPPRPFWLLQAKGLSVNNSYNLLVILAITRVRFQLK